MKYKVGDLVSFYSEFYLCRRYGVITAISYTSNMTKLWARWCTTIEDARTNKRRRKYSVFLERKINDIKLEGVTNWKERIQK